MMFEMLNSTCVFAIFFNYIYKWPVFDEVNAINEF